MTDAVTPAPPPLLAALGQLAATYLAARPGGKVRIHGVEATSDGVAVDAEVKALANGLGILVNGRYRIELAVLRTGKESTLCDVRIAEGRAAGRLLNWGLRLVPGSLLNGLLRGQAGGSLHWEGDRVRIDHQALVEWLLRR
jgi:hypothetical protein